MVALSALVEKLGLVFPSRNGPHSGCPYAPHPSGLRARARMSAYPSGVFGYPSVSAIGFGMAMTSGVSWSGVPAGGSALFSPPGPHLVNTPTPPPVPRRPITPQETSAPAGRPATCRDEPH